MKPSSYQKKFLDITARLISLVFSPFIILPVLFILFLFQSSLDFSQMVKAIVIIFIGMFAIWLIFFYLLTKKIISDWDMRIRKERYLFNFLTLLICVILYVLLVQLKLTRLSNFALTTVAWFTSFTVITYFSKISAHTASITYLALLLINLYGPRLNWFLITIPMVSWSRIYRKNHTFSQVLGGVILSLVVVTLAYFINLI